MCDSKGRGKITVDLFLFLWSAPHGTNLFHAARLIYNVEENVAIACEVCRKLAHANGSTLVALPLRGVSENDRAGKSFYSQQSDEALFDVFREDNKRKYTLLEPGNHINDPEFADVIFEWLVEMMRKNESRQM